MSEIKIQTLEEKADDFAYISLKIQAEMYDTDKKMNKICRYYHMRLSLR